MFKIGLSAMCRYTLPMYMWNAHYVDRCDELGVVCDYTADKVSGPYFGLFSMELDGIDVEMLGLVLLKSFQEMYVASAWCNIHLCFTS